MITFRVWLILRNGRDIRLVRNRPTLLPNEVAIEVNIKAPSPPRIIASVDIELPDPPPAFASATIQEYEEPELTEMTPAGGDS
jgi:hypothetical protein